MMKNGGMNSFKLSQTLSTNESSNHPSKHTSSSDRHIEETKDQQIA